MLANTLLVQTRAAFMRTTPLLGPVAPLVRFLMPGIIVRSRDSERSAPAMAPSESNRPPDPSQVAQQEVV